MDKELDLAQYYDDMQQVVEMYITGNTDATKIARELGWPRKKVLDYIDQWKRTSANDVDAQARAREMTTAMDKHFDLIIKEMWDIVKTEDDNKIRATVLKNLADTEGKRQDALQKAGTYDMDNMADEMADMQHTADQIKELLKEVVKRYPETRLLIMDGLTTIFGGQNSTPAPEDAVIVGEISGV